MSSRHTRLLGLFFAAALTPLAAVTVSQFNVAVLENFDTLANATGSVVPPGWQFIETGTSANTTYGAGTGSATTGNTYSFGATGSTERAFGSVRTSGVASTFGALVTNVTGGTITALTIEFTGEQWRLGALGRVDQLDFSYSTDATSVGTGSWLDVDALDTIAPVTSGITGALDGNAPENQILISHTLSGLNLLTGSGLWLRWVDVDASGSDDGLAIDNFSILAVQSTTGGGGGDPQSVPENLPTGATATAMAGLLALAARFRRKRTE